MVEKFTLSQAIEKFSDPDLLVRFDIAEAACRKRGWISDRFHGIIIPIGRAPKGYPRLEKNWSIARAMLYDGFLTFLRAGNLVAFGTPVPATTETKAIRITVEQWSFLCPIFSSSSAEGGGLRFAGIWVEQQQIEHPLNPPSAGVGAKRPTDAELDQWMAKNVNASDKRADRINTCRTATGATVRAAAAAFNRLPKEKKRRRGQRNRPSA